MSLSFKHQSLDSLAINQTISCVYPVLYFDKNKKEKINYEHNVKTAKTGNSYLILEIFDKTMPRLTCYFFFKSEEELEPIFKRASNYFLIKGSTFIYKDRICIRATSVIDIRNKCFDEPLVFNTANFYSYDEWQEKALLSPEGKKITLVHTGTDDFQDNVDACVDINDELEYKRVLNSPYDTFKIDVFVSGCDEPLSIPAYITPTMATLIDKGHRFKIIVIDKRCSDKVEDSNVGLVVNIKNDD